MQRRGVAIEPVEVAHEPLHASVRRLVDQMPRQALLVVPFRLLAELAAHEHQFLAGMGEHEAVIGAQIGETLPRIARHAAKDRPLSMHDFVVG